VDTRLHVSPSSRLANTESAAATYRQCLLNGFTANVLPRTMAYVNCILIFQVRVVTAPTGCSHVAPRSVVRMTVRCRLHAAQPLGPTKSMSENCPMVVWGRNAHVAPLSSLRRRKPPPPVRKTVSGAASHTFFTSGDASACRLTGAKLAPPSALR
jgi:hypothetical protein